MTSGHTRVAGVIGWPVRHSRSPAIHNAAYAAVGLDWTYVAFPVAPGDAAAALTGMRSLEIAGLSVTMPHKGPVAAAVDQLTTDAVALRAVNSVQLTDSGLVGDNTDGAGFVDSLRIDEDLDPSGMHCVVVGAGGAARAVVRALALAGADAVTVVNRTIDRAEVAAALAGDVGRVGGDQALRVADLVVNATPLGMGTDDRLPFDPALLPDSAVVADLVYHPLRTSLLAASEARGLRIVGGLGMLVHQAARQFTAWTGVDAPVAAMRAAALEIR